MVAGAPNPLDPAIGDGNLQRTAVGAVQRTGRREGQLLFHPERQVHAPNLFTEVPLEKPDERRY